MIQNGANSTAGLTVWEVTAFGCEIPLLHTRFGQFKVEEKNCNNGDIIGRSVVVEMENGSNHYISRLVVVVKSEIFGKDIQCTYDDGVNVSLVGSINLSASTICMSSLGYPSMSTSTSTGTYCTYK